MIDQPNESKIPPGTTLPFQQSEMHTHKPRKATDPEANSPSTLVRRPTARYRSILRLDVVVGSETFWRTGEQVE